MDLSDRLRKLAVLRDDRQHITASMMRAAAIELERLQRALTDSETDKHAAIVQRDSMFTERNELADREHELRARLAAYQPIIDAADAWLKSRERCNSPDPAVANYSQAVDSLVAAVDAWRARLEADQQPEVTP
jgi:hypothetical protein